MGRKGRKRGGARRKSKQWESGRRMVRYRQAYVCASPPPTSLLLVRACVLMMVGKEWRNVNNDPQPHHLFIYFFDQSMIDQNERGNKRGAPFIFSPFLCYCAYLPPFWLPIETRPRSGNHKKLWAFNGYLTELPERLCSIFPPSQEVLDGSRLVNLTAGCL
jgi:hypothetical protein